MGHTCTAQDCWPFCVACQSDVPAAFFVFNATGGGSPNKPHATYQDALDEAKRLAARQPGNEFVVLAPISVAKVNLPPADVRDFGLRPHF